MREILFRGKRVDNGNWIISSAIEIQSDGKVYLRQIYKGLGHEMFAMEQVIPESVGQFTGLLDKNDIKIFEGDIVITNTEKNMCIAWSIRHASFTIERKGWAFRHYFGEAMEATECEVIGNIHDNPELLNESES